MSAKSLRENRQFTQLPHVYRGYIPVWPLSTPLKAELDYWKKLWRKPQAEQWAKLDMKYTVARYVRVFIESTSGGATASMVGQASRLEDSLGLSINGMRQLGWVIAEKPVKKSSRSPEAGAEKPVKKPAGRQTSTGTWLEGVTVERGA